MGDVNEILPLLSAALDTGKKKPAPAMKKIRRATPKKERPSYKLYVCNGCGYEYNPTIGDPSADIAPGTTFDKLPADWVCPECAEEKTNFVEVQ